MLLLLLLLLELEPAEEDLSGERCGEDIDGWIDESGRRVRDEVPGEVRSLRESKRRRLLEVLSDPNVEIGSGNSQWMMRFLKRKLSIKCCILSVESGIMRFILRLRIVRRLQGGNCFSIFNFHGSIVRFQASKMHCSCTIALDAPTRIWHFAPGTNSQTAASFARSRIVATSSTSLAC